VGIKSANYLVTESIGVEVGLDSRLGFHFLVDRLRRRLVKLVKRNDAESATPGKEDD
jgi:hypothetical protein